MYSMNKKGFTLIEVLVMIVILGVLSTLAILALRSGGEAEELETTLNRLSALIEHQCDDAQLQAQSLGLTISHQGYRFVQRQQHTWVTPTNPVYRQREWPRDSRVRLYIDGYPVALERETAAGPHILCAPTGELTPFELLLSKNNVSMELKGQLYGDLEVDSSL